MKQTHLVKICLLFLSGCGYWGPVINNARDISSIPEDTTWVRARSLTDANIPSLVRLQKLEYLDCLGGRETSPELVTANGFKSLARLRLPDLDTISIGYDQKVNDDTLLAISEIATLKNLRIYACDHISGRGLGYLVTLNHLKFLSLAGCHSLTDSDIMNLAGFKDKPLESLRFDGCTRVTQGGIAKLQQLLPNCHVGKDDHAWELENN